MARRPTQTAAAATSEADTSANQVPAATASASVPAYLQQKQMTGTGVSKDQSDILIPMARVLQPLSPQVLPGNPEMIAGALAGDILIKNAPKQLIKGQQGFLFQSCYFYKDVVEWRPRTQGGGGGTGFVTRYKANESKDVPNAVEVPDPRDPTKKIWINDVSKNWLVDTRYHVGFIIDPEVGPIPCYIPFSSTGHSVSKQWMFSMGTKTLNGAPVDMWAIYYLVRTKQRTRNNQTWFVFEPGPGGPNESDLWCPTDADFERGKALHDAMSSGEVGIDTSDMNAHASDDAQPQSGGAPGSGNEGSF